MGQNLNKSRFTNKYPVLCFLMNFCQILTKSDQILTMYVKKKQKHVNIVSRNVDTTAPEAVPAAEAAVKAEELHCIIQTVT